MNKLVFKLIRTVHASVHLHVHVLGGRGGEKWMHEFEVIHFFDLTAVVSLVNSKWL